MISLQKRALDALRLPSYVAAPGAKHLRRSHTPLPGPLNLLLGLRITLSELTRGTLPSVAAL